MQKIGCGRYPGGTAVKIDRCEIYYCRIPLKSPYVLSFTTVEHLDIVVVRICLADGRSGAGEAVPLPGYTKDTIDSIKGALLPLVGGCAGLRVHEAVELLCRSIPGDVIALSAILTAVETAFDSFSLPPRIDIPLLAPVSASPFPQEVLKKTTRQINAGYRTIKLKIGRSLDDDCKTASLLLNELPDGIRLRIDANQGYNLEQAMIFLDILRHPRRHLVDFVEQPLPPDAWESFAHLKRQSGHVRLMLDESIVCDEDVEKAARAGADVVKLKLCKHRGLQGLKSMAKRAGELGMEVVLGNGVASDLGNIQEAILFQEGSLFVGASEGNGFEKLSRTILDNPPAVVNGRLQWNNDGRRMDELVNYSRMQRIA